MFTKTATHYDLIYSFKDYATEAESIRTLIQNALITMAATPSPSTRSLGALPSADRVRELSQSLAILDAVLSPEWEHRYYSFNSQWGTGEMMASMRNGSGDEYFTLFDSNGAAMKGFDHEARMSPWSGNEGRSGRASTKTFRNRFLFSATSLRSQWPT